MKASYRSLMDASSSHGCEARFHGTASRHGRRVPLGVGTERSARWFCQTGAVSAYLVTGNPGSGKSTMVTELIRRGFRVIDTDDLAGWVDGSENRPRSHWT